MTLAKSVQLEETERYAVLNRHQLKLREISKHFKKEREQYWFPNIFDRVTILQLPQNTIPNVSRLGLSKPSKCEFSTKVFRAISYDLEFRIHSPISGNVWNLTGEKRPIFLMVVSQNRHFLRI